MTLAELDRVSQETTHRLVNVRSESIEALTASIEKGFECVKGRLTNISNTGEPYAEFSEAMICRNAPFDMEVAKREVLDRFAGRLRMYLAHPDGEKHTIYWRIKPEEDWRDSHQVIRYDDNGPDRDFFADRRCFLDRNWKRYGVYCRLLISNKPILAE